MRELVPTYTGPATTLGRDVTWDLAGNLYALSSGNQLLRIFSPGGATRAVTRSDGTFTVIRPPAVSVEVRDAVASEAGTDPAVFSIYRTGDTSNPLTVTYTLTGLASNGFDYVTNELSAIIPANETNVVVSITPIDDVVSEVTETVLLTIVSTSNYDVRPPISGLVHIVDNDRCLLTITPVDGNTFEPLSGDVVSFQMTRAGDTNIELFVDFVTTDGSAIAGVDYQPLPTALYLPAGMVSAVFTVAPLDDPNYEGTETITVRIVPGNDPYDVGSPGSATATLRDDEFPGACLLFTDAFEINSSANWITLFGASNNISDSTATFAFDYSSINIPAAPHSGGTTRGLYAQVNKDSAGSSAALNFYPAGQSFSGNYALRFDMFLSFGTAGTTEHALAGLNHSGLLTNRVMQSADPLGTSRGGDGIFVAIETDGSANREYGAYTITNANNPPVLLTNRTAAAVAPFISSPPYAFPGSPGTGPASAPSWSVVELAQLNGFITLKVNDHLIYSFTNRYGFNSGTVMLGMNDQFDSVGSLQNFVIFDNVQVVSLDLAIKSVELIGGNQIQIDFVSPLGGTASDLHLQSSTTAQPGSWADDNSATITALPDGFRAVTTRVGAVRFYQIRR